MLKLRVSELDGFYADWAAKVEKADVSELKEMYDHISETFPQAGSIVLAAARAFVLEIWADKDSLSLIKAVFLEEDPLEPSEVGIALAQGNAQEALQLVTQTMMGQSEEEREFDGEDWHELLQSIVGTWAALRPEEWMKMIGPLQPWYIQHGLSIALGHLSKTNAAEAVSHFDRWIKSGQLTAVDEIDQESISEIARNYYQQNGAVARGWVASISVPELRQLAAQAYCLCLAEQESEALIAEFSRTDSIALNLPSLPFLIETHAGRPSASLREGLQLVQAIAKRMEKPLAQPRPDRSTLALPSPDQEEMLGSGFVESPTQPSRITVKYTDGGRGEMTRGYVFNYAMTHGNDADFWTKFASEVSALPQEWNAELNDIVHTTIKATEPYWQTDPLAALKATAALPPSCQAPAMNQILQSMQELQPAGVPLVLASMAPEQLEKMDPEWRLMKVLGADAPTTPFTNVEELINQTSGLSPEIEKFVVETGMGGMGYMRKLAHTKGIETAAQWATTLPPARAPMIVSSAIQLWAYLDDAAAADWVMNLPVGPLRTAGANGMAASLAPYDREASQAWRAKAKETP